MEEGSSRKYRPMVPMKIPTRLRLMTRKMQWVLVYELGVEGECRKDGTMLARSLQPHCAGSVLKYVGMLAKEQASMGRGR